MSDRQKIIEVLRKELESKSYVHAFWEEGSSPQGFADEYSDLDLWLSVDDDKVHMIFDEINHILSKVGEIDYEYISKPLGELDAHAYHIKDTNEHLFIDVNTQGISRDVYLTRGIDEANIIFDKRGVVKFKDREEYKGNIEEERQKLNKFFQQQSSHLKKSMERNRPLEVLYYWDKMLQSITVFLRKKHGWHDKTEYDLKHIHRDLPEEAVKKLQYFYDTKISEIESKIQELQEWKKSL